MRMRMERMLMSILVGGEDGSEEKACFGDLGVRSGFQHGDVEGLELHKGRRLD